MLSGVDLVFYFGRKLLHAYSSKNVNSNTNDLDPPRIPEIQKHGAFLHSVELAILLSILHRCIPNTLL